MSGGTAVVVLAAGAGTRMRSALPKPLHPVAGLPMLEHVLRAAAGAAPERVVLVVGAETADVATALGVADRVRTVLQPQPRGTGDAVRLALPETGDAERIVVLYADHPLLDAGTVAGLASPRPPGVVLAVLTAKVPDAAGYGRIERDAAGRVTRIVEKKDDDDALRQGVTEVNSGMMALAGAWARHALPALRPNARTGEVYLTDLVALAVAERAADDAPWPVASVDGPPELALGVNTRAELAAADGELRRRIRQRLMAEGVTLVGPETIFVDADVAIGPDTTLLPHTVVTTGTVVGARCVLGPHAVVARSTLADDVVVRASTVEDAVVGPGSDIGPYSHLRGGATLGTGVHLGNFVEVNRSRLGDGVKSGHFSYLGDAEIGPGANIGAGTVTANFDGVAKHPTTIGRGAFIGSDTILRAPVRVGDGARTGAGSVVTRDVPDGATAVGVPARLVGQRTRPPSGT